MNNLPQIFMYQGSQIRTVIKDNEPWWVAKDVCEILGFVNNRDAVGRLDDDEKGVDSIDTLGGIQQITVVNESGLYSLILGSRKTEAKQFKRWITHEVLPTIRKHGAYMTSDTIEKTLASPDFIIQLATRLKDEQHARLLAESKIAADRHKVVFAESLEVSNDTILVGHLAKILKQNGINTGETRLFEWLRQNGYLVKSGSEKNMPTQRSLDMKLMEVKFGSRLSLTEGSKMTKTTKITGKGVSYFINKFKEANQTA